MEKSALKAGVIMFLLLAATLTVGIDRTAVAQGTPTIYLDPSVSTFDTSSKRVGDRFNVTVWLSDGPPLGGWQVFMSFDNTVINITRWFEPNPLSDSQYVFYGKATYPMPPPPNPYNPPFRPPGGNTVIVGSNLQPPPPSQPAGSGTGKLCIIEFEVLAIPPLGGSLSSPLHINDVDTFLLDADGNEVFGVTKQDGSYTITFTTLPSPYVVVNPALTRFSAYENVVGKQFNVTIVAKDVDPAHNLNAASVALSYNQTLLSTEPANVTIGSIWGQNTTTVADGRANVAVSNPSSAAVGTVTLCTVEFTIMQQDQSPPDLLGDSVNTTLEIVSSGFQGGSGSISPGTPQNASVSIYAYQAAITKLVIKPFIIDTRIPRVGGLYQSSVRITDVYDLYSIQVKMFFDPAVLSLNESQIHLEGGVLASYATGLNAVVNLTEGYLIVNIIAAVPIPLISGTLFDITFNATGLTPALTYLNFSEPYGVDTLAVDSLGTMIPLVYGGVGLEAEFVWTPSKPGIVTTIQFNDTSLMPGGHIVGWFWDFGDGTNSSIQNATHRFVEYNNDYYVNLTITGEDNSTTWIVNRVHIYVLPPTVSFYILPENAQTTIPIRFADNSTDPQGLNMTTWFWDFGDGTNSTDQNPYHTYDQQGDYNVTLTVGNSENVTGIGYKIVSVTRLSTFELPVWSLFVIIIAIAAVVLFVMNYIRKRRMAVPIEEE